jgi:hypothetical protein
MFFPSAETSSAGVEKGAPHNHELRNAEPIRVCVTGMRIYAVTRGDDALVDAIESIMEGAFDPIRQSAPIDASLADQLRTQVAEDELIWWLQTERLAHCCAKARAIYNRLAGLRLRSSSSTTYRSS